MKPIALAPGYFVTETGEVWSEKVATSKGDSPNAERGALRMLKPRVNAHGYLTVNLSVAGRRDRPHKVHRLVCAAFHGNPPEGSQCVRHLDGNKTNNLESNLCWGTIAENAADSVAHGTWPSLTLRGSKAKIAKLREGDIPQIVARLAGGESQRSVGESFGVSQSTIARAVGGKTWTHVVLP